MRSAVVDYSRFGHTRVVAEELARTLGATLREVRTTKEHSYLAMGLGALLGLHFSIEPMDLDFTDFDVVVVCTPIWAHRPACPIRTFLRDARLEGKRLIVVFTIAPGGERGEGPALEHLRNELAGRGVRIELVLGAVAEDVSEDILRATGGDLARRIAHRLKLPLAGQGAEQALAPERQPDQPRGRPKAPPPAA